MGGTIAVIGMVLSAMPIGEYDKRLVILTRERGKISAFAKGARRINSSFMAGSRPFSFGEFELYEGRSSYTVSSMCISNYFEDLSSDVMGALYGFYFLELAEYFTRENVDESKMLKLLYQSFRALLNQNIPNELVKVVYELKAMAINGEYPQVFSCMECGEKEGPFWFSVEKWGILCKECSGFIKGKIEISGTALYTMQFIITSSIEKLYTFNLSDNILQELKEIVGLIYRRNIDRNMKSLEILKSMY